MKENQPMDNSARESAAALDEYILFESSSYNLETEYFKEERDYRKVMKSIEAIFTPSVLVGTAGLWDGKREAYRYFENVKELRGVIANYDGIIIRQIGVQLHFTLIHHDGRHEMQLRRLADDAGDILDDPNTWEFIEQNSLDFGRVDFKAGS